MLFRSFYLLLLKLSPKHQLLSYFPYIFGNNSKKSETFSISTEKWKIDWFTTLRNGEEAYLRGYVYRNNGSIVAHIEGLNGTCYLSTGEDDFFVRMDIVKG
jgi:hypothetical protein